MLYVGRTNNLKRRINDHFKSKVRSTKKFGNMKLIFYEAFLSKQDCIRREKYFKSSKGKSSLKQIVRNSIII
jgi:putative endonuclease